MSPDKRQHRGAHPADERLFSDDKIPGLRAAVADLSWLLSHGYSTKSALKLVGDQYALTERQRTAVSRAACTDAQKQRRCAHCVPALDIRNEHLIIDGFNLIITIEAALGGGALFVCRDNCMRDLSSVHGSYRSVAETERALILIGEAFAHLQPQRARWFLDRPVSNSGRLAQKIKDLATTIGWAWSVEVVFNPDRAITGSDGIVVTSDSLILDGAEKWMNLNEYLVRNYLKDSWIVDLKI